MKKILLVTLVFGLIGCKNSAPIITDDEIKEVISFFMDSIISKSTHGGNFIIIPSFDAKLSEKDFQYLIKDSLFTKDDVNFMTSQYNQLKERNLKDFIENQYMLKFDYNEPKNNGQVSYHIDPPLFNLNKNRIIIYFKTFFWSNDDLKWNDFYIICTKKETKWKLEGVIKSPT
jgi:hypothetical protein